MNDSNYWGPPRHDLPLTHSTPNPTDSYHDPGIGGGSNWGTPTNVGSSWGGQVAQGGSGYVATGVGYGGPVPRGKRSPFVAALLTLFLGPLGLFYVGILHGVAALLVLPIVVPLLSFLLAGSYAAAVPILWCIAIPWAIVGMKIRNARIDRASSGRK
jgi:hypothetical protein